MKNLFRGATVAAIVFATIGAATSAHAVILSFPSSGSQVTAMFYTGPLGAGGGGVNFNTGDRIDETFLATGLPSTGSSNWLFQMSNFTSAPTTNTFNCLINGNVVGNFSFTDASGSPVNFNLNFSYAPISGPNYTLSIVATSTVAPGLGSWNWMPNGRVTLDAPVPEPATFAILGLGLIPFLRRRRR